MKNRTFLFIALALLFFYKSHSQDSTFMGYATAFIDQDSIREIKYVGFSDREKAVKYDSATIQPIASVSKTFIGVSLLIAQEKGLLDLDADIRTYLDFDVVNPHNKKNNMITLRHLATHTSGIVDNEKPYESSYSQGLKPNMELGDYLKAYLLKGGSMYSKKNFSKSSAGKTYAYSNIASALAAYVVEQVSGKPFDVFTNENIMQPLGMKNTGWFYKDIDQTKHAILYDEQDKPLPPYACAVYPDGSLKTTIQDLSLYLIELMKGYQGKSTLLSEASWKAFFEKQFTDKQPVENISKQEPNTGIFVAYFKSGAIGHTGSDLGVSAFMMFNAERNTGKIFMSNEDLITNNLKNFKSIWKNIDK